MLLEEMLDDFELEGCFSRAVFEAENRLRAQGASEEEIFKEALRLTPYDWGEDRAKRYMSSSGQIRDLIRRYSKQAEYPELEKKLVLFFERSSFRESSNHELTRCLKICFEGISEGDMPAYLDFLNSFRDGKREEKDHLFNAFVSNSSFVWNAYSRSSADQWRKIGEEIAAKERLVGESFFYATRRNIQKLGFNKFKKWARLGRDMDELYRSYPDPSVPELNMGFFFENTASLYKVVGHDDFEHLVSKLKSGFTPIEARKFLEHSEELAKLYRFLDEEDPDFAEDFANLQDRIVDLALLWTKLPRGGMRFFRREKFEDEKWLVNHLRKKGKRNKIDMLKNYSIDDARVSESLISLFSLHGYSTKQALDSLIRTNFLYGILKGANRFADLAELGEVFYMAKRDMSRKEIEEHRRNIMETRIFEYFWLTFNSLNKNHDALFVNDLRGTEKISKIDMVGGWIYDSKHAHDKMRPLISYLLKEAEASGVELKKGNDPVPADIAKRALDDYFDSAVIEKERFNEVYSEVLEAIDEISKDHRHEKNELVYHLKKYCSYSGFAPFKSNMLKLRKPDRKRKTKRRLDRKSAAKLAEQIKGRADFAFARKVSEKLDELTDRLIKEITGEDHKDVSLTKDLVDFVVGYFTTAHRREVQPYASLILNEHLKDPASAKETIESLEKNKKLMEKYQKQGLDTELWRKGIRANYQAEPDHDYLQKAEERFRGEYDEIIAHCNKLCQEENISIDMEKEEDMLKNAEAIFKELKGKEISPRNQYLLKDIKGHINNLRSYQGVAFQQSDEINFEVAQDMMEIANFGRFVNNGCLNLVSGVNKYSAFVNAIDANKQVIYARNNDGEVMGRCLTVLTNYGIIAYKVHEEVTNLRTKDCWLDYLVNYAKGVGTCLLIPEETVDSRLEEVLEMRGAEPQKLCVKLDNAVSNVWYNDFLEDNKLGGRKDVSQGLIMEFKGYRLV
jgi:hypothetical protein